MYKSECSKCKRVFETEVKYYNYICNECTRKQKEAEREMDLRVLAQFKKELDRIRETGDEEMIKRMEELYRQHLANLQRKYGGS